MEDIEIGNIYTNHMKEKWEVKGFFVFRDKVVEEYIPFIALYNSKDGTYNMNLKKFCSALEAKTIVPLEY